MTKAAGRNIDLEQTAKRWTFFLRPRIFILSFRA